MFGAGGELSTKKSDETICRHLFLNNCDAFARINPHPHLLQLGIANANANTNKVMRFVHDFIFQAVLYQFVWMVVFAEKVRAFFLGLSSFALTP